MSREPGHLVNEHLRAHPRLLGAEKEVEGRQDPPQDVEEPASAVCRRHHKGPTPQV